MHLRRILCLENISHSTTTWNYLLYIANRSILYRMISRVLISRSLYLSIPMFFLHAKYIISLFFQFYFTTPLCKKMAANQNIHIFFFSQFDHKAMYISRGKCLEFFSSQLHRLNFKDFNFTLFRTNR